MEAHGEVRPFSNIVASEERHIVALKRLFARYEIPVPEDTWPERVKAPASVHEACRAGVEAERDNAELYRALLEATRDYTDVQETFRSLLAASQENHLRAFERCVSREAGHGDGGRRPSGGRRHRGGGGRRSCRPGGDEA
jgi:hypothetical protein